MNLGTKDTKKLNILKIICVVIALACIGGVFAYFTDFATARNEFSIDPYYTVTFDANEGTGTMNPQRIAYNVSTPLTTNTYERMFYTFDGWNTAANGSGTSYTDGESVTNLGDIRLYAQWVPNVTFTITGEVVGGHGTITGVPQTVIQGDDSSSIQLTPERGYRVASVMMYLDGSSEGTDILASFSGARARSLILEEFSMVSHDIHLVVSFETAPVVAQVVTVPTGFDSMTSSAGGSSYTILNHQYTTLEDAILDAQLLNDAKLIDQDPDNDDEEVRILILTDIDGEINDIDSNNYVVIDVNGHTISGSDEVAPIIEVRDGARLTIVNGGNEFNSNTSEASGIVNLEGISIIVRNGGSLTLGVDDGVISQISPSLVGNTYGIYREVGSEFNFYDGRITGNTDSAIAGNIAGINTPDLYDVTTQATGIKEEAYLAIPAGFEAMIGRTRYETLELAYAAVENNANYTGNTPVEIDVIAEVTLESAITLSSNKNVVLDLNGHSISQTGTANVFINNGKMEIKDSTINPVQARSYATLTNNNTYYFTKVGDHLEANNQGVHNSSANSYIEIDLTDKLPSQTFTLAVNANISCGDSCYGYLTVTDSTTAPAYSNSTGRLVNISGMNDPQNYTTSLTGGSKYYLHLGYTKLAECADWYLDNFIINSITLNGESVLEDLITAKGVINSSTQTVIRNNAGATLKLSSGNIECSYYYGYCVLNEGTFNMVGGRLADLVYSSDTRSIWNQAGGIVNATGGVSIGRLNNLGTNSTINIDDGFRTFRQIANASIINIDGGLLQSGSDNYNIYMYEGGSGHVDDALLVSKDTGIYMPYGNSTLSTEDSDYRIYDKAFSLSGNSSNVLDIISATVKVYSYYAGNTMYAGNSSIINIYDIDFYSGAYNSSGAIQTAYNGVINMYDGTIETPGSVINCWDGTFNMYGGTIKSTNPGNNYKCIYVMYNGIANIGTSDHNVSTTNPTIQSENLGIACDTYCTINIYDGQIIAAPGKTVSGAITSIEETNTNGDSLAIDISAYTQNGTTYDRLTLQPVSTVAKIAKSSTGLNMQAIDPGDYTEDANYYYFDNLGDAVAVCDTSAGSNITTIEIIGDISTLDSVSTIAGQNIEIDINGHNLISYGTGTVLINNGTLSLTDTSGTGKIRGRKTIFDNKGTATISINMENYDDFSGYYSKSNYERPTVSMVINTGTLTQNGGTLIGYNSVVVENNSLFTLNNGTIGGRPSDSGYKSWAVGNFESARFVMNGGTLNNTGGSYWYHLTEFCIANEDTSTTKINGGTISEPFSSYYAIWDGSTSKYVAGVSEPSLYIAGGTITGQICTRDSYDYNEVWIIKDPNSTLSITGNVSTFSILKVDGVTLSSLANVGSSATIENSTITGEILLGSSYTIHNNNIATDLIKNSTISTVTKRTLGTLTIDGCTGSGNISNQSTAEVIIKGNTTISTGGQAVQNSGGGTITVGEKEGSMNENYPTITGSSYGIYDNGSGSIKFYDGIITGALNQSIYGTVADTEVGYDIIKITDDNTESSVLRKIAMAKILKSAVNSNNLPSEYTEIDTDYYGFFSLTDAFNACTDGVQTDVIITRDITITSSGTAQVVPSTKNIVLDLAGYNISSGLNNTLTNNGTLEIVDTDGSSVMTATCNNIITNNGTMEITDVTINMSQAGTSGNETTLISNTASSTMTLTDCTITMQVAYSYIINNAGDLAISGGTYSINPIGADMPSKFINNTGDATIEGITGVHSHVQNSGTGTIELIDVTSFDGGIINTSTSTYVSGVSKPAVRIKGGTYDLVGHAGGGYAYSYNITNNSGEIIIENNSQSNTDTLIHGSAGSASHWGMLSNNSGTITINSGTLADIGINNSATIVMNDGLIQKNGSSIKEFNNGSGATFTMNGGKIKNYQTTNNGTFTLGSNDGTIQTNSPIIEYTQTRGDGATTVNNGTFNFYDGKIIYNDIPIEKSITNIATNSNIILVVEDNKNVCKLNTSEAVAIVDNQDEYSSLGDAFAHCTSGSHSIQLLKSVALIDGDDITISSTQDITLDLNGHRILTYVSLFENNGTFEITDSSTGAAIDSYGPEIIANTGDLTISGGDFRIYSLGQVKKVIGNTGSGEITITGGSFYLDSEYNIFFDVINSTSTGDITITGGTFGANGANSYLTYTIINVNNTNNGVTPTVTFGGTATIATGSKIKGFGVTNADVNITGGTINNEYSNTGTNSDITITGGTINGETTIDSNSTLEMTGSNATVGSLINNGGIIDIDAGTVNGTITNNSTGTITIDGATINGRVYGNGGPASTMVIRDTTITGDYYPVEVADGTITLDEDVTVTCNGGYDGAYVRGGTLNIPYISSNNNINETTITSTGGYGVYIRGGTLNLGTLAYPVYRAYPQISGGTYGVYVNYGTFNFYDGEISGTSGAISGAVTNTPSLYSVHYTDQTETVAYLAIEATVENVVQVYGNNYSSLASAINAIKNSTKTGTIIFLRDVTLTEGVTIPSDTNITFDMQNRSLIYVGQDATVTNNGTLTIIDSLADDTEPEYGFIENFEGPAIQNNGTLTVGEDDGTIFVNTPRIIGKTYAVVNESGATFSMFDGTIEGITAAVSGTVTTGNGMSIVDGTESRTIQGIQYTYYTKHIN